MPGMEDINSSIKELIPDSPPLLPPMAPVVDSYIDWFIFSMSLLASISIAHSLKNPLRELFLLQSSDRTSLIGYGMDRSIQSIPVFGGGYCHTEQIGRASCDNT